MGNNNYSDAELDNHANQLNPNNEAYHRSRGKANTSNTWDDDEDDYSKNSDGNDNDWDDTEDYDDCGGGDYEL